MIQDSTIGFLEDLPQWAQAYIQHLWKEMGLVRHPDLNLDENFFDPGYIEWLNSMHDRIHGAKSE